MPKSWKPLKFSFGTHFAHENWTQNHVVFWTRSIPQHLGTNGSTKGSSDWEKSNWENWKNGSTKIFKLRESNQENWQKHDK